MWSWFLASRALCLLLLVPESGVLSDIAYFARVLADAGPGRALPEYPWPTVALLYLPLQWGISGGMPYHLSLVALFLAIDAAFTWHLWRAGGARVTRGLALWLLLGPVLGPLVLTRFDTLAAALAASALLALAAPRPAVSGALVALGCGIKLFPVLGAPALLLPGGWRARLKTIAAVALAGLALTAATVAAAGFERLWSPLAFQAQRGLHVEAFAALPLLWARHFDPGAWQTVLAECRCWELQGPGVAAAMQAGSGALLLGLAGVQLLHARAFAAPPAQRTVALAARLTVLFLIVWIASNKVFSPQYLIWLAAPLAALGAMRNALRGEELARADLVLLALACALTQAVFPLNYPALAHAEQSKLWVLAALTLRDAAIASLGLRLAAQIWRSTARG